MTGRDEGTLRSLLRRETRDLHDRLDSHLGHFAVDTGPAYRRFLQAQYCAHHPIENWIARHMSAAEAPPPQCAALLEDLRDLDAEVPRTGTFEMPADADPVGLRWALAGSSFGNRALLVRRRKLGVQGPDHFLSNDDLAQYFRSLLPAIEQSPGEDGGRGAIAAAKAVFAHFLGAVPLSKPAAEAA